MSADHNNMTDIVEINLKNADYVWRCSMSELNALREAMEDVIKVVKGDPEQHPHYQQQGRADESE